MSVVFPSMCSPYLELNNFSHLTSNMDISITSSSGTCESLAILKKWPHGNPNVVRRLQEQGIKVRPISSRTRQSSRTRHHRGWAKWMLDKSFLLVIVVSSITSKFQQMNFSGPILADLYCRLSSKNLSAKAWPFLIIYSRVGDWDAMFMRPALTRWILIWKS